MTLVNGFESSNDRTMTGMHRSSSGPRHGRRLFIAAGALALLLISGGVFVVLWRGSGAHEASTNDAKRRFEHGSTSAKPPNAAAIRPPAGVYLYRGTGTEHLSLPPKTQHQGDRMPATVTYRSDGCWTFRLDYNTHHWQTWVYCPRNGGLVELGGQTFEQWDFVFTKYDSTSKFTCDPPSIAIRAVMRAGDVWTQRCRGASSGTKGDAVTSGPYTFVGDDVVTVGATRVPAYHFRQVRTLSGSQTGTQTADLWFARSNGLPLRNQRNVTVKTDTVVGLSTYTEHGSFQLTSLRPQG